MAASQEKEQATTGRDKKRNMAERTLSELVNDFKEWMEKVERIRSYL